MKRSLTRSLALASTSNFVSGGSAASNAPPPPSEGGVQVEECEHGFGGSSPCAANKAQLESQFPLPKKFKHGPSVRRGKHMDRGDGAVPVELLVNRDVGELAEENIEKKPGVVRTASGNVENEAVLRSVDEKTGKKTYYYPKHDITIERFPTHDVTGRPASVLAELEQKLSGGVFQKESVHSESAHSAESQDELKRHGRVVEGSDGEKTFKIEADSASLGLKKGESVPVVEFSGKGEDGQSRGIGRLLDRLKGNLKDETEELGRASEHDAAIAKLKKTSTSFSGTEQKIEKTVVGPFSDDRVRSSTEKSEASQRMNPAYRAAQEKAAKAEAHAAALAEELGRPKSENEINQYRGKVAELNRVREQATLLRLEADATARTVDGQSELVESKNSQVFPTITHHEKEADVLAERPKVPSPSRSLQEASSSASPRGSVMAEEVADSEDEADPSQLASPSTSSASKEVVKEYYSNPTAASAFAQKFTAHSRQKEEHSFFDKALYRSRFHQELAEDVVVRRSKNVAGQEIFLMDQKQVLDHALGAASVSAEEIPASPQDAKSKRSSCFFDGPVCSECEGREQCLARNQLNLADDVLRDGKDLSKEPFLAGPLPAETTKKKKAETTSAEETSVSHASESSGAKKTKNVKPFARRRSRRKVFYNGDANWKLENCDLEKSKDLDLLHDEAAETFEHALARLRPKRNLWQRFLNVVTGAFKRRRRTEKHVEKNLRGASWKPYSVDALVPAKLLRIQEHYEKAKMSPAVSVIMPGEKTSSVLSSTTPDEKNIPVLRRLELMLKRIEDPGVGKRQIRRMRGKNGELLQSESGTEVFPGSSLDFGKFQPKKHTTASKQLLISLKDHFQKQFHRLLEEEHLQKRQLQLFTGQSVASCSSYHNTNHFLPVSGLYGLSIPDLANCLSAHYSMTNPAPGSIPFCDFSDVCSYSERLIAEMQLTQAAGRGNEPCDCEICAWGKAWHEVGEQSATCPNDEAASWRTACNSCYRGAEIDLALISDADLPKAHRFEEMDTRGECVDSRVQYVAGRGRVVGSHLECREACYRTAGKMCLGYTYYHCSQRCLVHLTYEGLLMPFFAAGGSGWSLLKGEGTSIASADGNCGSKCYRVTYGECPAGSIMSNGILVDYRRMVYGQTSVFDCPSPFGGEVEITCAGRNSMTVDGMCMSPCNSGEIEYRPGLPRLPYPTISVNTRIRIACPFAGGGDIEILCQSNGEILVITTGCGSPCSAGLLALPWGTGTIPYPDMTHRQPVPPLACPFSYTGSVELLCLDSIVTVFDKPGSGCFLHCPPSGRIEPVKPNSCPANETWRPCNQVNLFAEYDLIPLLSHKARLQQMNPATMTSQIFFHHGKEVKVPCGPLSETDGEITVGCFNGEADVVSHTCSFNCLSGSLEVAYGGHTLMMSYDMIPNWSRVKYACSPNQLWEGQITLECWSGRTVKTPESVCHRHCEVDYLVSNGLNVPLNTIVNHNTTIEVDCTLAANPSFAGKLSVSCNNGAVTVDGYCGRYCPSTLVISSDALVLTVKQEHTEVRVYPCPKPWTGDLTVRCDDTKIQELTSCGRMCPIGTILIRGVTEMQYPKQSDVNAGMMGIDHGVTYNAGCPELPPSARKSYTGTVFLTCDNGELLLGSIGGFCWENCVSLTVTSNGFPLLVDRLDHEANRTMDCAAGREYGYLDLECYDGKLSILGGSCVGAACAATTIATTATSFLPLSHPKIFHLSELETDCPLPLTGRLTLWCEGGAATVSQADCGRPCNANGTIPGVNDNMNGFPLYAGIKLNTPYIKHSETFTMVCPAPALGTVTLTCRDGTPQPTQGGCNNPCPAGGWTSPSGAYMVVPYRLHGETVPPLTCPSGTTAGGVLELLCSNGTFIVTSGLCLSYCDAGEHVSNGVTVRYSMIPHDMRIGINCNSWNSKYNGNIDAACYAGTVTFTGQCERQCESNTITSRGAVLPFSRMISQEENPIPCSNANIGAVSFSGTVTVKCVNGRAQHVSGECYKDCSGSTELFQSLFNHGFMAHNTMVTVPCPASGVVTLLCFDSRVTNFESICFQSCSNTDLFDIRGIKVSWTVAIPHGQLYPAPCDPSIASGTADIVCTDGESRIQSSSCRLNCPAGSIRQPDPDGLYSYPIILAHGDMLDGGTESSVCPAQLAGRVILKCEDSVVSIDSGSCGTSNCMPSESQAGENLMVAYPQLNHGEIFDTQCGPGFVGDIRFRCDEGVAIREWIKLEILDITQKRTTVELCECCLLSGYSQKVEGDGSHDLSLSTWESARGAWLGMMIVFPTVIGFYVWYHWKRLSNLLFPHDGIIMRVHDKAFGLKRKPIPKPKAMATNKLRDVDSDLDSSDAAGSSGDLAGLGKSPLPIGMTPVGLEFPEDGTGYKKAIAP